MRFPAWTCPFQKGSNMLIRQEDISGSMAHLINVLHHRDEEQHYFEQYYPTEEAPDDLWILEVFIVQVYRDASGYYLVRIDMVTPVAGSPSQEAVVYFRDEFKPALFQELGTDNMAIYIDSLGHKTYICELPH